MSKESTTPEKSNEEQPEVVYGLYAKTRGRGKTKANETLLSVYKSHGDAIFVKDFVISEGRHNVPFFNLSENDELFIKNIPAYVSFGKTLPSVEQTFIEVERELDRVLESIRRTT